MEDEPAEPYLNAEQAARVVGFTPGTLRRWGREGRIPTVVIAGRRWFRREDLEALIRRCNDCC
jgi:excisionase family DNA binding protein